MIRQNDRDIQNAQFLRPLRPLFQHENVSGKWVDDHIARRLVPAITDIFSGSAKNLPQNRLTLSATTCLQIATGRMTLDRQILQARPDLHPGLKSKAFASLTFKRQRSYPDSSYALGKLLQGGHAAFFSLPAPKLQMLHHLLA